MSEFAGLFWRTGEARIRKCATTTTAKATVLRIEIEVTDGYALSQLMRDIQERMKPPAPQPAEPPILPPDRRKL